MKKNFFKKLSFVLALAMIVTALAPATGVFAAAKAPKLNASSKYLHLDVEGKNEYDFNIKNKQKGWKYLWASANKDVVTVNKKNGIVTATGAGSTKVSVVISDKDGEEVDELTAKVTVRDNIKELTITNTPADNKLAVGASNDFNRSYVTIAGNKKGSKGITRWSVTDKDGKAVTTATISDAGIFTATEAGEFTISARAFQSKAKYASWLSDSTKYASYVTSNVATFKVTVAPSMTKVAQTTLKKFDVTFDSAVTKADVEKNMVVYYVLGGTKVKESVKSVSMSADNKTATVEMNYDLTKGTTYVVDYPNMKSVEFVSATAKVEDVVDIAILTKTAQLSKDQKLDIALYNKDHVNIANDDLLTRVKVEKSDNNYVSLDGKILFMHKLGEVVKLTATFQTYNWKDGKEVGNVTATGDVTCVEVSKDLAGEIYAWTIKDAASGSEPTNFTTTKTQAFKGDISKKLYVVLKGKDTNGDVKYTSNFNYTGSPSATEGNLGWKYKSSNEEVLFVDPITASVYGVKEGSATVVVSYNDVQVGACEINVAGARKAAMATLSKDNITLSNEFSDPTTLTYKVQDQFGDDYKVGGVWQATAEVTPNGSYSAGHPQVSGLTFDAHNVPAGSYNYTVKIKDINDSNAIVTRSLVVIVQDPGQNTTTASYRLETDNSTYDMKSESSLSTAQVKLSVYAYNSANIKVRKLSVQELIADGYEVKVSRAGDVTGTAIISNMTTPTATIDLVTTTPKTVSGAAIQVVTNQKEGSWMITAYKANALSVTAAGFEVKNTKAKAGYSVKTSSYTDKYNFTDLAAVINELVSFTAGDKSLRAQNGYIGVDPTNYHIVDKNVSLYKIKLYELITGNIYVEHEVDLKGLVLRVK